MLLKSVKIITVYSKKYIIIEYFCENTIQNVQFVQNVDFAKFFMRREIRDVFHFRFGAVILWKDKFCEVKKYEKESRACVRRKVV